MRSRVRCLALSLVALACAEPALPVPAVRQSRSAAPLYPEGANDRAAAPYQIDAGASLDPGQVAVDLGSADTVLDADTFHSMTIVGAQGASPAVLVRFGESCLAVCGSERPPICHAVGVYAMARAASVGTPLAALPGRVEVAAVAAPRSAPGPMPPAAERFVSERFQPAPEVLGDRWITLEDFGYRWAPGPSGRVHLESNSGGELASPDLATCRESELGDLTQLRCESAAFLYEGEHLLVASFAAEVPAAADLLARFRADDRDYGLVAVGLRTRRAVGLLERDGAAWRIILRPPDYPAAC